MAELIERAAEIVGQPGAWTQDTYGRDATGVECGLVEEAVCFCAMGAIYKAAGLTGVFEHHAELIAPLADVLDRDCGIDEWNDHPDRTQEEVVAKLNEAAALVRARSAA